MKYQKDHIAHFYKKLSSTKMSSFLGMDFLQLSTLGCPSSKLSHPESINNYTFFLKATHASVE